MHLLSSSPRIAFTHAFAAATIFLFHPPKSASAQASFDGSWSVLLITDTGECDRAYRYGIRIKGGQIIYGGEAGVTFTGRVDSNGQLTATVRRGEQRATGSGSPCRQQRYRKVERTIEHGVMRWSVGSRAPLDVRRHRGLRKRIVGLGSEI